MPRTKQHTTGKKKAVKAEKQNKTTSIHRSMWFYLEFGSIVLLLVVACFIPLFLISIRASTNNKVRKNVALVASAEEIISAPESTPEGLAKTFSQDFSGCLSTTAASDGFLAEITGKTLRKIIPTSPDELNLLEMPLYAELGMCPSLFPNNTCPVARQLSFFSRREKPLAVAIPTGLSTHPISIETISEFFCASEDDTQIWSKLIFEVMQQDPGVAKYMTFVFEYLKDFKIVALPKNLIDPLLERPGIEAVSTAKYDSQNKVIVLPQLKHVDVRSQRSVRHEFRHAYVNALQTQYLGFKTENTDILIPGYSREMIEEMLDEGDKKLQSIEMLLDEKYAGKQITDEEKDHLDKLSSLMPSGYTLKTLFEMIKLNKVCCKFYPDTNYLFEREAFIRGYFPTKLIEYIYPGLSEYMQIFFDKVMPTSKSKNIIVIRTDKEKKECLGEMAKHMETVGNYEAGFFYYYGLGVPIDYEEAARFFSLAAEQGHKEAQYILASMYAEGMGVPKNEEEAARLVILAAEQGHMDAQFHLAVMYRTGCGVSQDYEKAAELYTKAAEQGHVEAQYDLALMYYQGLGIRQSYTKAAELYTKAAGQGHKGAQYNLATMHYQGYGIPIDYEEAARLFNLAAEQGCEKSQYNLATMYYQGRGVEKNLFEAEKWFKLAAAQGYRDSVNILRQVSEEISLEQGQKMRIHGPR